MTAIWISSLNLSKIELGNKSFGDFSRAIVSTKKMLTNCEKLATASYYFSRDIILNIAKFFQKWPFLAINAFQ